MVIIAMEWPGEKLCIKMWETLAEKGIGKLLTPKQIRLEGRATTDVEIDRTLRLAQAKVHEQAILRGELIVTSDAKGSFLLATPNQPSDSSKVLALEPLQPLHTTNTITGNVIADSIRREVNVAKVILQAEAELENDTQEPSSKPINDDWLYRWRDYAGEVSSADLQSLWGKLLAGEVRAPGTFSLRTLEFLRNISSGEAQDIAKLMSYVIEDQVCISAYKPTLANSSRFFIEREELSFTFISQMEDLGIILSSGGMGATTRWNLEKNDILAIRSKASNKVLVVEHSHDTTREVNLNGFKLTSIGKEILLLGHFMGNESHLCKIGKELVEQGFGVKIADYTQYDGNKIRWINADEIILPTQEESLV